MEVVGIGFSKTGTTTLGECLRHFGFKHVSYDPQAVDAWRHGQMGVVLRRLEGFDSCEDWPWPLVYPEIDRAFPEAKYILTRRKDALSWFDSYTQHSRRSGLKPDQRRANAAVREAIFGSPFPDGRAEEHIGRYEAHLESVRAYFANRPDDLLEVCWEEGDGWAQLALFLDRPVPHTPFPHANPRQTPLDKMSIAIETLLRLPQRRAHY